MSTEDDGGNSFFKSKHTFDLRDAMTDVELSSGAAEKSVAILKVAGKGLFNTAFFAGKAAVAIAKEVPNAMANKIERQGDSATDKQKEFAASVRERQSNK